MAVLLCLVGFVSGILSPASSWSDPLDGRLYSHSLGRIFISCEFITVLTFSSILKDLTKQGDLLAFIAIAQVAPCQQGMLCCASRSIITSLCLHLAN